MRGIMVFLSLFVSVGVAQAQQVVPFDLQENLVHVHAVINGKRASAVLDSGTGTLVVSKHFATGLGLKLEHSQARAKVGGDGPASLFPLKLKTMRLGSIVLNDTSGYALDLHHISKSNGFTVDAILGYPFFADRVIAINYPDRRISIYDKGEGPKCPHPIPMKMVHNVPVVVAKTSVRDGGKARIVHLVVDLGTRHFAVMLGGAFLKTDLGKMLVAHGKPGEVGTGIGGKMKGVVANLPVLELGGRHFRNLSVALTKHLKAADLDSIDGTLGVPLWKGGSITFDYPGHQLCINMPQKSPHDR